MGNLRTRDASEALIQYEASQELQAMSKMTQESTTVFNTGTDKPWSNAAGKEPEIRPDGMLTGGAVTPTAVTDEVNIAAGTCWQAGVLVPVTATDATIDRFGMSGTDDHMISIVVVDATGAYDIIDGTPDTAFDLTDRGAAGQAPAVPQGQIQVAEIRVSSEAVAVIADDEIYQVDGTHKEMAMSPIWTENFATGEIRFISALPEIHAADGSGNKTKLVYAEVYTPVFASIEPASDFVPIETTHSVTSTEVYGGAIGASSSSLGQGSFNVFLLDGVTDSFLDQKDNDIWIKFFPHRLRAPFILTQGKLGISRTFPAGDNIQAACTISGSSASEGYDS